MRSAWETFFVGSVGMTATISGTFISLMNQVEAVLRILSLIIGIAVGVLTIISLLRNFKNGGNK